MSSLPSVRSKDIYDTDQLKPIEFVHERFFNNISLAKGWRESVDGLLNYSLDVVLPVKKGEAPITLAYSPFISVPFNADPTCHPSNFVFAKTVANNTVRIYAMKIPNPTAMLPVTISMKQINTNEGTTNGSYNPSGGLELNIEKTSIQVKGTSFIVNTDENGYTTKETKLEMNVTAYKGSKKIKAEMGNVESKDVMFNLDGTAIETVLKDKATAADKNKVQFSYSNLGTGNDKDTVAIFITVPKGVLLKDRMAYFIFPISAVGEFFARSTLYTDKSDEVITSVKRYEINFPKLSRTTGNVYFANGQAIGSEGFTVTASEISANNVRSDADGILKISGKKGGSYTELSSVAINGTVNIIDPAFLNGYTDLKLEFYTSSTNKKVYEDYTKISSKGQTIYIRPSQEYLIPTTNDNGEFILPEVSVTLLAKIADGAYELFYGDVTVKDSSGLTLATQKNTSSITIPSKAYVSSELPTSYNIEVTGAKNEIKASKFISILKQGDAEIPFFMDITPSTLVIPTTPDGGLGGNTYDFTAKMMRGAQDVSNQGEWKFEVVTKDPDIKIVKKEGTKNVFTVEAFTGSSISKVIKVEATLGNESYAREIVITKLKQSDSVGNYTFVKWGVAKIDEDGNIVLNEDTGLPVIEFTIDEQGTLPPGEIIGDYYGVASTDVDSPPSDPEKYKWITVSNGGAVVGEQGPPGAAFYIDGDTIVKQKLSLLDEPVLTPRILSYELIPLGEVEPLTISWQTMKNGKWEPVHDVESSSRNLILDTSKGLFDFNNKLAVRAVVESTSAEAGDVLTYYSYINTYLIYSESPTYFARLRTNEASSKSSYVFPIDSFGNTVSGTEESGAPLGLLADVYKGTGKLKYWHEPINLIEGEEWEIANQPVNLIENGWDSFKPYGSGKNYFENWNFESDSLREFTGWKVNNTIENGVLTSVVKEQQTAHFQIDLRLDAGEYVVRYKVNHPDGLIETAWENTDKKLTKRGVSQDYNVYESFIKVLEEDKTTRIRLYPAIDDPINTYVGNKISLDWIQVTPIDNQHLVVEKTPLGNGLTRIQTWGGNDKVKLMYNGRRVNFNFNNSLYIENNSKSNITVRQNLSWSDTVVVKSNDKKYISISSIKDTSKNAILSVLSNDITDNLDFIASDPQIVEGSTPALTVLKEPYPADSIREGWVENLFVLGRVNNLAVTGTDKIAKNSAYRGYTFPVKPGEEYTLSRSGEVFSNRFRVIFTEEEPDHDVQGFGYISNEQNEKTFTVPEKANYMLIYLSNNNEDIRHAMRIKLERGPEKTFWTKALEDCRPEELTNTKIQLYGGSKDTYLRKKGMKTENDKDYGYGVEIRNSGLSDISIGSDINESIIPKDK